MKNISNMLNRYLLAGLIVCCLFGGLFPFLNVDLGFIILTPIRTGLILVCVYCFVIWCIRLKKRQAVLILRMHWREWSVFFFLVMWCISGIAWLLFGNTNGLAPTEVMGVIVSCMFAFCVFTLVGNAKDIYFLLHVLVICGVILSVMASVEVVMGSFVENTKYYFTIEQRIAMEQTLFAPTTVFYNPNDYAAFILLCLAIVSFWIIQAKTDGAFWGSLLLGVVLVVPASLTTSTLFNLTSGFLVILTVLALLLIRREQRRKCYVRGAIIIALALAFVLFGSDLVRSAAIRMNSQYFTEQIRMYHSQNSEQEAGIKKPTDTADTSSSDVSVDSTDSPSEATVPYSVPSELENPPTLTEQLKASAEGRGTIHTRSWLIYAGWVFFTENPLIGCGPASYQDKMAQNSEFLEQTGGIVDPHFFYVEMLSQYGGILFAMYMAIVLYLVIKALPLAVKELKTGCPGRGILCLLLLGVFSISVIMPSSVIKQTPIWMFFVLTVAAFSKMQPVNENT